MKQAATTSVSEPRCKLALLIAAHNEELVLENTLRSAIAAGMNPADIYVADDNSDDRTRAIAASVIGFDNVYTVLRSGKGLALTKAIRRFELTKKYEWVHISDADGAFASDYFRVFKDALNVEYAAATGYIRSLPGSMVSQYRVFEYAVGMEINRRIQSKINMISIVPGATSCFRADILEKVNFANSTFTEDFDVTLQIYRQKLGSIQYIPQAVAYTQDPRTLRDFIKQLLRWNRGLMQGIGRHRIGRKMHKEDVFWLYMILQNFFIFFNYLFWVPYLSILFKRPDILAYAFLSDVCMTYIMTVLSATRSRRGDIVAAFPQIYALRWVSLLVFVKAFIEVGIFGKFSEGNNGVWSTRDRRYKTA